MAACAAMAMTTGVWAEGFTMTDFDTIVDAGTHNEAKFYRDYAGKPFEGVLPFESIKQFIGWHAHFKAGSFAFVACDVGADVANGMADWTPGQTYRVTGTIENTFLGNLILKDCQFQTSSLDKIGPDARFSPPGKPVRMIPLTPTPAPDPTPAPTPAPTSDARHGSWPGGKNWTPPHGEPEPFFGKLYGGVSPAPTPAPSIVDACRSAGLNYDTAHDRCLAPPPPPAAPIPVQVYRGGPIPPIYVPTPTPAMIPPGYPAACPWPLPRGYRCTYDGAASVWAPVRRITRARRTWPARIIATRGDHDYGRGR